MPDFTFSGEGVKIASLSEESPASKAGLQSGDIVIQIGPNKVKNLRDYSDALKSFSPGDKVDLIYIREGKEIKTKIELGVR